MGENYRVCSLLGVITLDSRAQDTRYQKVSCDGTRQRNGCEHSQNYDYR